MKRLSIVFAVMATLLLTTVAASGQCSDHGIAPSNTMAAVKAIRAINTAEAASHFTNHRYLSLQELAQDKVTAPILHRDAQMHFDSGEELVPGFRATLLVSPDGSHYLLKVFSSTAQCPGAIESDQTGIIYLAQALH